MSRQVTSRSQRRLEKKQALVLVVLGLVIALVSYGLGVVVGRSGGDNIIHEDIATAEKIAMPPVDAIAENGTQQSVEETADPQLSFYDTLSEGKQPPMGSGINLPAQSPQQATAPVEMLLDRESAEEAVASKPAPVEVKPKPATTVAPQPKVIPEKVAVGGNFIIQVASVQKMVGAQDLSGRLSKSGYTAFVEKTDLGSKGVWYRVYVGPFASKNAADGAASSLKASRLASSPLVRKR